MWKRFLSMLLNKRGGGGSPPQVIQPPPPPPPPPAAPLDPSVTGETSRQLFESQLEFNPQLTQQNVELQQQFAPELAALNTQTLQRQAPLLQALTFQMFPELQQLQGQVQQRLVSPEGLTPEQSAAQQAIRERAGEDVQRAVRESANLGGGLFGGRRQEAEVEAAQQLQQAFAAEDIDRAMQQRQQTLQELRSLAQIAFPQVQQPSVPQFGRGVTPDPNALIAAIMQQQSNFPISAPVVVPGQGGFFSGLFG